MDGIVSACRGFLGGGYRIEFPALSDVNLRSVGISSFRRLIPEEIRVREGYLIVWVCSFCTWMLPLPEGRLRLCSCGQSRNLFVVILMQVALMKRAVYKTEDCSCMRGALLC